MMKIFFSFVNKEIRHILRDRRTMLILFGMPLVLMLLFGFAISTDVRNVRLVAVTTPWNNEAQQIFQRLDASEYFTHTHNAPTVEAATQLIRNQQADLALVFAPGFDRHRYDGGARIQIITDGVDPNMSHLQTAYASQIIAQTLQQQHKAGVETRPTTNIRLLYNPQMKSTYYFVPGIMGILLLIICTMMTAVSIVREKERGTMEVLLVSPMRPLLVLIAKAVPYLMLSVIILSLILCIANFVLGVPLSGNLSAIFTLCLLYVFLALSLGLLISVLATTQIEALLASGMMMLMPTMLLSGIIYPIESMPQVLQWLSCIIPARWFIAAIRKLIIMGVGLDMVIKEMVVLISIATLALCIALKKFKIRLE